MCIETLQAMKKLQQELQVDLGRWVADPQSREYPSAASGGKSTHDFCSTGVKRRVKPQAVEEVGVAFLFIYFLILSIEFIAIQIK